MGVLKGRSGGLPVPNPSSYPSPNPSTLSQMKNEERRTESAEWRLPGSHTKVAKVAKEKVPKTFLPPSPPQKRVSSRTAVHP
jgi:hypothetical protein